MTERTPEGDGEAQDLLGTLVGVLVGLAHEPVLPRRDEEFMQLFVGMCKKMLPGRLLCLRLIEPDSGHMRHVVAIGRLGEANRETIRLSRRSVERHSAAAALPLGGTVVVEEGYVTVFENTVCGFDVPLHDGRNLLGVLSIEYLEPSTTMDDDERLVTALAALFTTGLRYSRLLGESMHLRDYLIKLLDNASAPIVVTDPHGRIKIINRAFEHLTGYDRTDVLDRDVLSLLPSAERDKFLPLIINTLRGQPTGTQEVRIPKKNGTGNAHIALSMAAVTSGFGDNEGIVAVGQDLTELRELQQQVIHSEKLATLGQLAAGVVHELNNPLTSISVYSEYLLKKFEEEERDAADTAKLRRICEGADRILRFTRDLVAYARPGGEEPRLVDMKGVVERSLVFCEHVIDRAGVTVVTEFEPDLPRVYGVKGQLQQILVNLVTNACDAMAGRNGRLTIGLSTVGERVRLAVTDNGPGIPEADLERVFEPFFSTKPEGKGTGLGLSIVRNIITNHNGTVKAVPAKGGGVTFVVELFASA